jgi:hypothetical protein
MSVSVNATGTEQFGNSSSTSLSYTGITVASGSNTSLWVWFGMSDQPTSITCTWDNGGTNQTMTSIGSVRQAGFFDGFMYGLVNPTTGNKTLRIAWTGAQEISAFAMSFDGTNTTSVATAFTNFNSNTTTSASPSVTITSASGNMVVAGAAVSNPLSAATQTSLYIDNNNLVNVYAAQRAAGASSVACGWTQTPSGPVAICGCNVVASAAATPVLGAAKRMFLKRHHEPFEPPRGFIGWRPRLILPRAA